MSQAHVDAIEKVRKLLRLSTSSNANEAALAAARAAELMLKHDIAEASVSSLDDDAPAEPVTTFDLDGHEDRGRRIAWRGVLAHGIARAFGCRIYWSGPTIKLIGRQSDLNTVLYFFRYLRRDIERLADEHWKAERWPGRSTVRTWKNSFRMGAAVEIARRLEAQRDKTLTEERMHNDGHAQSSTALTVIAQREAAIDRLYEGLHLAKGRGVSVRSSDGYAVGQRAGRAIDLGAEHAKLGGSQKKLWR